MSESSFRTYATFQAHNFFRRPDWRWRRLLHLLEGGIAPMGCSRRDDACRRRRLDRWLPRRQTGRMPRRLGKVVRRAMGDDRQASQHQAAQQFEIDKQNVMAVFKMHLHIMKSERSKPAQQSNQHEMGRSIEAMLDALPWATVDDAEKLLQQNASGLFADLPENLTEDELLRLAAGDVAPNGAKKPRKADAGEQQKRAREPR